MASFGFGDVVLVDFPFSDRPAEKRRPGLVLSQDPHGDILLARISSNAHEVPTDVTLADWREAGLNIPSTIRLLKLATTHETTILKPLSRTSVNDLNDVVESLQKLLDRLKKAV